MDGQNPSYWRMRQSFGNGGNCVETMVTWQKSSRSGLNGS